MSPYFSGEPVCVSRSVHSAFRTLARTTDVFTAEGLSVLDDLPLGKCFRPECIKRCVMRHVTRPMCTCNIFQLSNTFPLEVPAHPFARACCDLPEGGAKGQGGHGRY